LDIGMILSDLASPADLPSPKRSRFGFASAKAGAGFAKAGSHPRIKSEGRLFGITR